MNKNNKLKSHEKHVLLLLVIGAFLVNIKSIFVDYDVDVEYAVTIASRLAGGDRMFIDMWEPNQTSAFLCAFLVKIFLCLFDTSTGLLLYLNVCCFIIYSAAVYFLYLIIKDYATSYISCLVCLFLFIIRVKDVQILEYASMQILFSIFLFGCLLRYFKNQNKKIWLVLSALSLCLEIISYPSCLVVFIFSVIVLGIYSEKPVKDIGIFSGTCTVSGILYLSYFLYRVGFTNLLESFEHILISDNYHKKTWNQYFVISNTAFIWMVKCFIAAVIVGLPVWYVIKHKKNDWKIKKSYFIMYSFTLITGVSYLYLMIVNRERFAYIIYYLLIIAVAVTVGLKYCNEQERKAVIIGMLISVGTFFATMILTDLDFLSVVRYMVIAVAVSFIPIGKLLDRQYTSDKPNWRKYMLILLIVSIFIFQRGFMFKSSSSRGYNLLDLGGIIKSGPEVGTVTEYFVAYNKNVTMKEWSQFVKPGDSLLMVGNQTVDCINYLYEDVIISNASTISTPTYTEEILKYWELHPDRYPTVIAVSCWFGNINMPQDSWIMTWINESYTPCEVQDGTYWRFYRLTE